MRLRENFRRADIKEKSGEETKIESKKLLGKSEKYGRKASQNRSNGIHEKKFQRLFIRIFVEKHQIYGI